jgi:hypothetical protein
MGEATELIKAILSWPVIILGLFIFLVVSYRSKMAKWLEELAGRIEKLRVNSIGLEIELVKKQVEGVNKTVERVETDVGDLRVDVSQKINQVLQNVTTTHSSATALAPTFIQFPMISDLTDKVEAQTRQKAAVEGLDMEDSIEKGRRQLAIPDEDPLTTLVDLVHSIEYLIRQLIEVTIPPTRAKTPSLKPRLWEQARLLRKEGIIPPSVFRSIQVIRDLRNRVVHDADHVPTQDEMEEVLALAEWVLVSLNNSLAGQVKRQERESGTESADN